MGITVAPGETKIGWVGTGVMDVGCVSTLWIAVIRRPCTTAQRKGRNR